MAINEEVAPSGTYGPPSTPVDYFNEVYGPMVEHGVMDDGGCIDDVGELAEALGCISGNMEQWDGNCMTREEKGRMPDGRKPDGIKKARHEDKATSAGKIPREKRVTRRCAGCGTVNHVRRLFCSGCFGGKDVMKRKKGHKKKK